LQLYPEKHNITIDLVDKIESAGGKWSSG